MTTAYYFRFVNDGEPTGWVGFAMADNQDGLMLAIDRHGDPYRCEVQTAKSFSCCVQVLNDGDCHEYSGVEFHDMMPLPDYDGWRTPSWITKAVEKKKTPPKWAADASAVF